MCFLATSTPGDSGPPTNLCIEKKMASLYTRSLSWLPGKQTQRVATREFICFTEPTSSNLHMKTKETIYPPPPPSPDSQGVHIHFEIGSSWGKVPERQGSIFVQECSKAQCISQHSSDIGGSIERANQLPTTLGIVLKTRVMSGCISSLVMILYTCSIKTQDLVEPPCKGFYLTQLGLEWHAKLNSSNLCKAYRQLSWTQPTLATDHPYVARFRHH